MDVSRARNTKLRQCRYGSGRRSFLNKKQSDISDSMDTVLQRFSKSWEWVFDILISDQKSNNLMVSLLNWCSENKTSPSKPSVVLNQLREIFTKFCLRNLGNFQKFSSSEKFSPLRFFFI